MTIVCDPLTFLNCIMLTILGPAKTLDMSPHGVTGHQSSPQFPDQAEELVKLLHRYSPSQLKDLMHVSDKLAFSGEVFNGLKARSLSEADLLFAQEHVRILSGLYGVLRPLDRILPYRLEMGTKMKNAKGSNLYEYWKGIIPIRHRYSGF